MTLGEKIQKLRKQQGLSQEALAEKVAVTRQTISKWELGQSLPDLDFIVRLSDIFCVTADYLIKDDMPEPDKPLYKKHRNCISGNGKHIILALFSAAALIAIFVCLICDYFTGEKLSWSIISAAAIIAAWIVLLPFLTAKTKVIFKTLLAVSAVPVPLLAVLALLLNKPLVFTMGACIAIVAVIAAWIIYGIFCRFRKSLWKAFGWALLVMIPAPIAITHIADWFMPEISHDFDSDIFNSGITFVMALSFFCIAMFNKNEDAQK